MTAARMSLQVARSLFVATALANLLVPQTTDAYFFSFEGGSRSSFVNASGSDFSWRRQSGQTPSNGTGPENDFTYKNSSGHYLYMDESAVPQGASATVSTPVILVPSHFEDDCYVSFYYSMDGVDVGQLSIYTMDVGSTVPAPVAWTRTGNQCTSTGWKFGQAKLNNGPGNQFQVYFNGTASGDGIFNRGDIGIDDVRINCGAGCRATNNRSFSSFSDFSYGLDGYTNSAADDIDWFRHNGTVPSYPGVQTGPLYDHTTLDPGCTDLGSLGGSYIYMETSSPVFAGQQAVIRSPPFTTPTTPSTCFVSFWYSMYGATIGSLNVTTDLFRPDAKWCRNGQQTSTVTNWRRGLFWVEAPGSTFQIIFTGTAGSSLTGDIGLDDIDISCCVESCVHFNRLTFECDNEGLMDTGAKGFAYQTSVADHTTQTENGARIFANSNQVGTIEKHIAAFNTMGMHCTVSFYFWIDVPSDNAAVANVTIGGFTSGQGFWGLHGATTIAREWTLQSGTFYLPAPDTSFQVTWKTNWDFHPWGAIYMDDIDFVCCPTTSTVETNAQTTGSCIGPCTPANTRPTTTSRATNTTGGFLTFGDRPSVPEESSTSLGILIGAIAGGFVVLAIVILLVALLVRNRRWTPLTSSGGGDKRTVMVQNPVFENSIPSSPLPRNNGRVNQPSQRYDSRHAQSLQQPATARTRNWTMPPSAPPAQSSNIDLTSNAAYGSQRPSLHLPHQVAQTSTVGMTSNTAYGVPAQGRAAPRPSLRQQQNGSEHTQHRGTVQETDGQEYYTMMNQQPAAAYNGNWSMRPTAPGAKPSNIDLTTNTSYATRRPSLHLPHQAAEPSTVGMTSNTAYGVPAQVRAAPSTSLPQQQNGSGHSQHRGTVQETDGQEYYSMIDEQPDRQRRPSLHLPHQAAEPSNVGMTSNTAYGVPAQGRAAPSTSLPQQQNGSERTQHRGTVQQTNGQEYDSRISQQPGQQRRPSLPFPRQVAEPSTVGMTTNTGYGVQAQGRAAPRTSLQHQQNGSEHNQHRGTVQQTNGQEYYSQQPDQQRRPSLNLPHQVAEPSTVGMTTNTGYGVQAQVRAAPRTSLRQQQNGSEHTQHPGTVQPTNGQEYYSQIDQQPDRQRRPSLNLPHHVAQTSTVGMTSNTAYGVQAQGRAAPSTSLQHQQNGSERTQHRGTVQPLQAAAYNGNWTMTPSPPPAQPSNIDLTTNTAYSIQRPSQLSPHRAAETSAVGMTTNTAYGALPSRTVPTTEAFSKDPTFPEGGQEKERYEVPDPPSETVLTTEAVSTDPMFSQGDKKKHDYEVPDPPSETVLTTEVVSTDPTFPQGDKKKHDYEVPDPPIETVLTTEAVSTGPMFPQGDKKKHDYEVPDPPSETVLTTEAVSTDPTFPQGDKKKHDYEVPDPTDPTEDGPYLDIIP